MVNSGRMTEPADTRITVEQIVDEALLLLKEEGFEKLSMRRLATRVGVKAPTLYYYLPDKSALMSAMMERLFGLCLAAVPETDDWQVWMRSFGRGIWQVQDIYPFAGTLIATSMLDDAYFSRLMARLERMLEGLHQPVPELIKLQSAVQSLMTGWATFAHARYVGQLGKVFDVESVAFASLEALIRGWKFPD